MGALGRKPSQQCGCSSKGDCLVMESLMPVSGQAKQVRTKRRQMSCCEWRCWVGLGGELVEASLMPRFSGNVRASAKGMQ